VKKQRAPALPDSATFRQLWDALGSKLIESAQGNLLYTQEVRGSSPLPPGKLNFSSESVVTICYGFALRITEPAILTVLPVDIKHSRPSGSIPENENKRDAVDKTSVR